MPDYSCEQLAFADVVPTGRTGQDLQVQDVGLCARLIFRGSKKAAAAAGAAFGVGFPAEPCRAASKAGHSSLWLGPDEWLLIGTDQDATTLAATLTHAIGSEPHSLVDVSHRNLGLTLSGLDAADVLSAGCPLDLDISAFPVGTCVRTLFGKAEIVLWRKERTEFHLEASRSFMPYLAGLLAAAAADVATFSR